ncbi:hypothetical protein MMC24_001396 [Lignoscripta atroalba]|nr:hypothetical protein [Lignoscripta atroalba]
MATSTAPTLSLAILDDYQDIAFPHFGQITPERLQISKFPSTLDPKDAVQRSALIKRLHPFMIISTMRERTPLPADVLAELPNLKVLLTTGLRNASISIPKATEMGVLVAGTIGMGRSDRPPTRAGYDSTAEHTWALILGLARNIARDDRVVKAGGWQSGLNMGLKGKTLGVLGLGRLGSSTAKIGAMAFGMQIVAWSSNLTQAKADERAEKLGLAIGAFKVLASKEDLFKQADVLSVHYVLSDRSVGLIGEKELRLLKKEALFVNTSRGPLVDEDALMQILKEGQIRGAALDVFDTEPLPHDSEWRSTRWGEEGKSEVVLSPHMGYVEEALMHNWYDEQAENLERWIAGQELLNKLN